MPKDLMTVRWGRKDCETSPHTKERHTFPEATMNGEQMMDYFKTKYNLTKNEVRNFSNQFIISIDGLLSEFEFR